MTCKAICEKYRWKKLDPSSNKRYANGAKRCQICEIFITWDGMWCPCCGYRLRGKPRGKKGKEESVHSYSIRN